MGKFKLKGHTLPGINQKSEGNTDMPDGRSKSSAFQRDTGSVEEKKVTDNTRYVETEGEDAYVVKNAAIVRLERNKPPVDSPNYAGWLKAYNKALANQVKTHKGKKSGAPNYKKGYYGA
tara:strand:+ start:1370 stop:1726 length:357 start_codon:yes stop_codon:yes gene_type:complete